jgi:hypothetical protein
LFIWFIKFLPDFGAIDFRPQTRQTTTHAQAFGLERITRQKSGCADFKGTILTELTGNPIAAQQALCHMDLSTTMRHYIKTKRTALAEGIQMLDERLALSK